MNNNHFTTMPVLRAWNTGSGDPNIGTRDVDVPQMRPVGLPQVIFAPKMWAWNDTEGDGPADDRVPTFHEPPQHALSRGQTTVAGHFS